MEAGQAPAQSLEHLRVGAPGEQRGETPGMGAR
jgi:hypothetical protein